MIIDCVSDLHGHYPKLDGGDLLIVAGDLTAGDKEIEYRVFRKWIRLQDYDLKVFIGGNHDNYLQKTCAPCPFPKGCPGLDLDAEYLCDSGTEFEGLKIWGSPWTKRFEGMNPHCMAFTVDTEEELAEKWKLIPEDTDILVTHGPPYSFLDTVEDIHSGRIKHVGSTALTQKCYGLGGSFPFIHVFGHIHEHGSQMLEVGKGLLNRTHSTFFINASLVNENYEPVNKPIRIEL